MIVKVGTRLEEVVEIWNAQSWILDVGGTWHVVVILHLDLVFWWEAWGFEDLRAEVCADWYEFELKFVSQLIRGS